MDTREKLRLWNLVVSHIPRQDSGKPSVFEILALVPASTWYLWCQRCMFETRMVGVAFDEILRTLPVGSDVQIELSDFPLDELLLTAHETRFTGRIILQSGNEADEVFLHRGKISRVIPRSDLRKQILRDALIGLALITEEVIQAQFEADPRLNASDLLDCFVLRKILPVDHVPSVEYEMARRHMLSLFSLAQSHVTVLSEREYSNSQYSWLMNPLPTIAYGMVACAAPARRQAMLAFAGNQFARLNVAYDLKRNRLGLPKEFMAAVERLSNKGIFFGNQPCLPGLTPDDTAGVLLLFRRLGLLTLGSQKPSVGESITAQNAMDDETDRVDREFI